MVGGGCGIGSFGGCSGFGGVGGGAPAGAAGSAGASSTGGHAASFSAAPSHGGSANFSSGFLAFSPSSADAFVHASSPLLPEVSSSSFDGDRSRH